MPKRMPTGSGDQRATSSSAMGKSSRRSVPQRYLGMPRGMAWETSWGTACGALPEADSEADRTALSASRRRAKSMVDGCEPGCESFIACSHLGMRGSLRQSTRHSTSEAGRSGAPRSSAGLSLQLLKLGGHFGRLPLVSGVELEDLAIGVDQRGLQVVDDLAALLIVGEPKEIGCLANLSGRAGGKAPVLEPGIGRCGVALAVGAEDAGVVEFGIDGDGEHLQVGEGSRAHVAQGPGHLGEVVAHARAIVRQRAARIDEGDEQRLAAKLRQMDGPALLVHEVEIGDGLAPLRQVHGRGGGEVGRTARLVDDDVLEPGLVAYHQ